MIPNAVRDAFKPQAAPKQKASPTAYKGGLDEVWSVQLGEPLCELAKATSGLVLAAATADGVIALVDGAEGALKLRCGALGDEPPNAIAFSSDSTWLVACYDDAHARVVSDSGAVVLAHLVAPDPEPGKRQRCVAAEHVVTLGGASFAAAAGRLVHTCRVPDGKLEHSLLVDANVRALCAAPPNLMAHWEYAVAYQGTVLLVSPGGEGTLRFSSRQPLRSLAVSDKWLAGGAFDGTVELWDVATRATSTSQHRPEADRSLQAYCGSDGASLQWRADGGGIAVSGARAAMFDFTGANPKHPYRSGAGAVGQPDPLPRVCMDEARQQLVAWAPPHEEPAASRLGTVSKDGVVRVWQPYGLPLRKGGKGDPAQPQRMKPQFYTFLKNDAAHPTGDAVEPRSLVWLGEGVVAVGFENGDLVAWRCAGAV